MGRRPYGVGLLVAGVDVCYFGRFFFHLKLSFRKLLGILTHAYAQRKRDLICMNAHLLEMYLTTMPSPLVRGLNQPKLTWKNISNLLKMVFPFQMQDSPHFGKIETN
jgi:hypothetical protein